MQMSHVKRKCVWFRRTALPPLMCLPARVHKIGKIESRGKVLKLSDKLNLTRPFTAREKNRPVIGIFHRVSTIKFFKISYNFKKNTSVTIFFK